MVGFLSKANPHLIRDMNFSLVFQQIQEHAPISQTELVRKTGLSPSTIYSLITNLEDKNLIRPCGFARSSGGRRPKLYELNPTAGYLLSVDLGGTKISVGVLDLSMNLHWQCIYGTPPEGGEAVYKRLTEALSETLAWCDEQSWFILGIGICTSGIVDCSKGIVVQANNLKWNDFPLRDLLCDMLGRAVIIEHDTNAAAYGEFLYGTARGARNLAYVSVGTGIGMGLILDGRLYTGSNDMAGEIGHVTVHRSGHLCTCGKHGCLEAVASGPSMAKAYHQRCRDPQRDLCIDGKWVLLQSELGDALCRDIVVNAGRTIGSTVGNLSNVLDLDMIVVGGGVVAEGHVMFEAICDGVRSVLMHRAGDTPLVQRAFLGMHSGLIGMGALTLSQALHTSAMTRIKNQRSFKSQTTL